MVDSTEEQEKSSPDEVVECEFCGMEPMFVALAAARSSCKTIKDPDKRAECEEWSATVDGSEYENAKDLLKDTIRRSGPGGLNVTPQLFNMMSRQAITEVVEEDMEWNKEHPDEQRVIDPVLLAHYRKYTEESLGQ